MNLLLIIVIAYLLGSIPFGYLLVRIFRGADVRASGSGNIGATNVARTSAALGLATLLLDAVKGALAVLVATYLMRSELRHSMYHSVPGTDFSWHPEPGVIYPIAVVAAVVAVLGHIFPLWLHFRGGKGVATAIGAFLLLTPKAILAAVGIFLCVFAAFRYVSLASVIAIALLPLLASLLQKAQVDGFTIGCMVVMAVFIILKHRENIRRVASGTESRFVLRRG
jgi:acyl phosphate:glycerol-3-phosphate acyltransferase